MPELRLQRANRWAIVLVATLLAGLVAAPAYGAVERTAHAPDCPVPLHAKVVQLGLAQVLAGPVATVADAPSAVGPAPRPADPGAPIPVRTSSLRARAPPAPSDV
jgi:hypothetical protein